MKKIVIVLPCYNEAEDLKRKMEVLVDALKEYKDYNFEYVISDDCSSDKTYEIAKTITYAHATTYKPHYGKGWAVKNGIKYALDNLDFDYIIFMDIDLSTELNALPPMVEALKEYPFVAGSRYNKDSKILVKQPFKRRLISKCSRIIIKTLFNFKVKDTQCGFKGMNKDVAKLLVETSRVEQFAFDVEYFYILKLNKIPYTSIPVRWNDDRGSTVRVVSSSVRFFKDLFMIKRNKKYYVNKVQK